MTAAQFTKNLVGMQEYMRNFARTLTTDGDGRRRLMQDTTLKALKSRHKFVEDVNFKGWVLTIMRNIFINNYHKLVRSQSVVDASVDASMYTFLVMVASLPQRGLWILKRLTLR